MKKEEVFVVIDTEKKAKKVAVLLHMFRQYESGYHTIQKCLSEQACLCYNVQCDYWHWSYYDDAVEFRKEVSVSELKKIIAITHLKKGDVVIVNNPSNKKGWVLEMCGLNNEFFQHVNSFNFDISKNDFQENGNRIIRGKFIRYATEEEKQLLNPVKKECEKTNYHYDWCKQNVPTSPPLVEKYLEEDEKHTGSFESLRKCDTVDFPNDFKELTKDDYQDKTWYKSPKTGNCFFLDKSSSKNYGFHTEYCDSLEWFKNFKENGFHNEGEWFEMTRTEVSQIFFKEIRKRFKNNLCATFNHNGNEATAGNEIVFKNGTWLEAKKIEIDPFKELKEAHKKGFEIEYKSSSGVWKTSSNPAWRKTGNYRIRPVKIGDWFFTTHEQTNVKYYYQVNETNINDVRGNHVRILNQMVIDILNNGKYTV